MRSRALADCESLMMDLEGDKAQTTKKNLQDKFIQEASKNRS